MAGLTPSRTLSGGDFVTRRFPVSCPAATGLYLNDVAIPVADGKIEAYAGTGPVLGVVTALYDSDGNVLTFSQPSGGPFLAAGSTGFADVIVGEDTVFTAAVDATAASTAVFANINVSAAPGTNASGLSGHILKQSTISTSADLPFKILGGAPNDETQLGSATDGFGSGTALEVVFNNTLFKSGTAGV